MPEFNLYDQHWPIRTKRDAAAAGQVRVCAGRPPHGHGGGFDGQRGVHRLGRAGAAQRALAGVRVNSYCEVEYSILMPDVEIGRYSRIRRAIVNTGVKLPESRPWVSTWKPTGPRVIR